MPRHRSVPELIALVVVGAMMLVGATEAAASPPTPPRGGSPDPIPEDVVLDRALQGLVALPGGPPGVIAIVQRGHRETIHSFGTREVGTERRLGPDDPNEVRPVVARTYPLEAIARAQQDFLGKQRTGKLVLVPPTSGAAS